MHLRRTLGRTYETQALGAMFMAGPRLPRAMLRALLALALLLPMALPTAAAACVTVPLVVGVCAEASGDRAYLGAGGLGLAGVSAYARNEPGAVQAGTFVHAQSERQWLDLTLVPAEGDVTAATRGWLLLNELVTRNVVVHASPEGITASGQVCTVVPPVVTFNCRNLANPVPPLPTDLEPWVDFVESLPGWIPCLDCPIPI